MAELDLQDGARRLLPPSTFEGWFNPGKPIAATAPPDTPARQLDYPQAQNLNWTPRSLEPIGFNSLRMFADNCYLVRVIKREKRACRGCEQGTVTMAALEPRIVEKGLASDAVVINTVVAKYCDHVPLYRLFNVSLSIDVYGVTSDFHPKRHYPSVVSRRPRG